MTVMIKRLQIEQLLMWMGLIIILVLAAGRQSLVTIELSDLDLRIAAISAGLLVLAGVMCKAWRQRESRRWVWFLYGAIATIGAQLFAHSFMERFGDLYLSLWLELFKIGLI